MPIKLSTAPNFEFSSAGARVCIEEEMSMLEIENARVNRAIKRDEYLR
jgi:hypothetical protein